MSNDHHEFCELFPDLPKEELEDLANDIRSNGQRTPITRWNGKILDGKNRFAACGIAGIEPTFIEWNPKSTVNAEQEALEFCVSANMNRRQLNESQRAMIAAKIATLRKGWQANPPAGGMSQESAADRVNASVRSTQRAKVVLNDGSKSLVKAVTNGNVSVRDAANIVSLPKSEQSKAVKAVESGKATTVSQAVKQKSVTESMTPSLTASAKIDNYLSQMKQAAETLSTSRAELLMAIGEKKSSCLAFKNQSGGLEQSFVQQATINAALNAIRDTTVRWTKLKYEVDK